MVCILNFLILVFSFSLLSLSLTLPKRANLTTASSPSISTLSSLPAAKPPSPSPASATKPTCKSIAVRKEWRALTYEEKSDYINSVKCLARLPSKLLGHSYRRWDDFQYVHCESRKRVHGRPIFLPWHRYFIFTYEKVLKEECGFKGNLPYWDWTLDYENITQSVVWSSDPVIGFGSNGTFFGPGHDPDELGAGVVNDGAFAKFPIYHPGRMMLQRNFQLKPPYAIPGYYLGSQWYNPNNMDIIFSQTNYTSLIMKLEGNYKLANGDVLPGPHSIIHSLLGGDMPDLAYSANDPIFYVHHARVDQVWFVWQMKDPAHRLYEFLPSGGFAANLDEELDYMGLVPKIKVREVMNPLVPPLCYRYE